MFVSKGITIVDNINPDRDESFVGVPYLLKSPLREVNYSIFRIRPTVVDLNLHALIGFGVCHLNYGAKRQGLMGCG